MSDPNYSSLDGVLFNKSQTTLIRCPGGKVGTYAIPNSVTTIDYDAFSFCANLMVVTIPDSVTTIGGSAFARCNNLASMTIPDSISTIDGGAFQWCAGLTNVTVGYGVTNIGQAAFESCTSLMAFMVDARNPNYSSLDRVLFNKGQTFSDSIPRGKGRRLHRPQQRYRHRVRGVC